MAATVKTWVDGTAPNCAAADLNGFKNENNNAIAATGQTSSDADNTQTSRAMTIHVAGGDFYTDSGSANSYTLTIAAAVVSFYAIPSAVGYFTGMRIRFVPANTNTSASTVNVSGIGAVNIFNNDAALVGGELQVGKEVTLSYNGTQFDIVSVEKNVLLSTGSYAGIVSVTATPYTVLASSAGKLHTLSSAASALTMLAIAGASTGQSFIFINYLATNCTIARDGSSTFEGTNTYNGSTTSITVPPYCAVIITKSAAATWAVVGINGGQSERIMAAGAIGSVASLAFVLSTLDPTQSVNNKYAIELINFVPVTSDVKLECTLSSDAGSTYASTLYYSYVSGGIAGDDGSGTVRSSSENSGAVMELLGASGGGNSLSNSTSTPANAYIKLFGVNTGTSIVPSIRSEGQYWDASAGDLTAIAGFGSRKSAADYDAFKLAFTSGNFQAQGYYVLKKLMSPV